MTLPFWPNEADAFATPQAEPDASDIQVILRALQLTGVVSGCAVTESGTPAQTVDVAAGVVVAAGVRVVVSASAGEAITAADSTEPRIDAISVNPSGTVVVTDGTPASVTSIVAPAWPAGNVPLAQLYVPASDNTHQNTQIVDKRLFVPGQIAGRVDRSSDVALTTSAWTVLPFDTSAVDIGGLVSTADNGFVVPTGGAGVYGFSCAVVKDSADTDARARLTINGTEVDMFFARSFDYKADDVLAGSTIVTNLTVGDIARVEYFFLSSGNIRGSTTTLARCVFTGWRI